MGSGSWVPAQAPAPQGAEPRGPGGWGAVRAPCPRLQRSETDITCGRSRGCPGRCPPPAGPACREPGAEAWYVSGRRHQFGSRHRKPLQWLPRGHWHLWAQILPEIRSSCRCQHCLQQRCWGLLAPRCCCGNGTGYPFISFSKQLTYWYTVRTSLS